MVPRIYDGPSPAVEVGLPDGTVVVAEHGKSAEFPKEVAEGLDLSGDWKTPGKAKTAAGEKE